MRNRSSWPTGPQSGRNATAICGRPNRGQAGMRRGTTSSTITGQARYAGGYVNIPQLPHPDISKKCGDVHHTTTVVLASGRVGLLTIGGCLMPPSAHARLEITSAQGFIPRTSCTPYISRSYSRCCCVSQECAFGGMGVESKANVSIFSADIRPALCRSLYLGTGPRHAKMAGSTCGSRPSGTQVTLATAPPYLDIVTCSPGAPLSTYTYSVTGGRLGCMSHGRQGIKES